MFGMKGIYISASGVVQGHHGPLGFFFIVQTRHCDLLFTTQSQVLMTLTNKTFKNMMGKGENAGELVFCPIPVMFSYLSKQIIKANFLVQILICKCFEF